ncbi:MAG: hypothetical protein K2W99_06825 [Chthoniobacterales bacterium]|nr:hypothetical protein [Chthoniobacterales bacterium]
MKKTLYHPAFLAVIGVFFLFQDAKLKAVPLTGTTQQGFLYRDYFLYLPQKIDPEKTYWLVVYAHGAQGHLAQDLTIIKYFSEQKDCIVIAPNFPRGYQLLEHDSDQRVIEIFDQLKKKYHLHNKFFILGHSAGGQFAHRFTLKHPDLILGCEACSSGTWATGGVYHSLNQEAEGIPIAIGCGAEDHGQIGERIALLSQSNDAKKDNTIFSWTRIEWFKKFEAELEKKKFFYKSVSFLGESHRIRSKEQIQFALEAFLLGTSGMLPNEEAQYESDIAAIQADIDALRLDQAQESIKKLELKSNSRSPMEFKNSLTLNNWHFNDQGLRQCTEAFNSFIKESISVLQKKIANQRNPLQYSVLN